MVTIRLASKEMETLLLLRETQEHLLRTGRRFQEKLLTSMLISAEMPLSTTNKEPCTNGMVPDGTRSTDKVEMLPLDQMEQCGTLAGDQNLVDMASTE